MSLPFRYIAQIFKIGTLILIIIATDGRAQAVSDSARLARLPQKVIKFSPLHLLNFYPTAQFSYEFRPSQKQYAWQGDIGVILPVDYSERFRSMRGIKLKAEYRWYFLGSVHTRSGRYAAVEAYGNFVDFDRMVRQTECFDTDCQITFWRQYRFVRLYREQGVLVKYGFHYFGPRLTFDWHVGLMLRHIRYRAARLPNGFFPDSDTPTWNFFPIPNERNRTVFAPAVSARVGYRLR